ncbi:MAG: hypothetical protein NC331_16350 [Lachnospiraceae bacterium]|nr:hypothetical protein [Lachnospiraceae bacterium]MCM1240921.1 hypothetical protein [Lachnospiraceae bacterium]
MKIKAGTDSYPKITCTRTVERRGNKIRTRIEMRHADGTSAGSISITKTAKKKTKKLQYNFKEISTRIMQAKTSGSASRVLTSAQSKVAMLKRKQQSGEYDDQELRSAIMHAEAIARVAKKRMKHLREEESLKKQGGPCEAELEEKQDNEETDLLTADEDSEDTSEDMERELQKLKREYQQLMRQAQEMLEESVQESGGLEELSEEISLAAADDMDPADLELMKKKHRAKEMREIMEADMKYLKAMFDKLEKEKQENASGGIGSMDGSFDAYRSDSVALEIGGADIPVQMAPVDAAALVEGGAIDASI